MLHTVLTEQVAEDLEVTGLIGSRVLHDFIEVGEGTPLSLFMGDDGAVVGLTALIVAGILYLTEVVIVGMRGMLVPVKAACPTLHMILRTIVPGPTATDGGSAVEARRVVALHRLYPVVTVGHPVAGRLIAGSHHHE